MSSASSQAKALVLEAYYLTYLYSLLVLCHRRGRLGKSLVLCVFKAMERKLSSS
jgi:hypothetical protein